MKRTYIKALLMAAAICTTAGAVKASDHDDGVSDQKSQSLNLTDLYLFKESSQISGGSSSHLVFVMNSNPRSLPRTQYYFSTRGRYDFRVSRIGTDKGGAVTGKNDVIMRFEFSAPDATTKQQNVTLTIIKDGLTTVKTLADAGGAIKTTSLALSATPVNNAVTVGTDVLNVFAGLREDPFFFDVTAFFKFRATGAGYPAASPRDFTSNYNVNSIVVRVPISFLQRSAETVFDTWAVISTPQVN